MTWYLHRNLVRCSIFFFPFRLGFTLHGSGHGHSHGLGGGHGHSHGGDSHGHSHSHDDDESSDSNNVSGSINNSANERDGLVKSKSKLKKDLNVRAAFIHVLGDLVQSVGVFFAALLIYFKV